MIQYKDTDIFQRTEKTRLTNHSCDLLGKKMYTSFVFYYLQQWKWHNNLREEGDREIK